VTGRFEAALEARRDALNRRFAAAGRGVSGEVVLAVLDRTVRAVVEAASDEEAPAVLAALFDAIVAGVRVGVVGGAEPTAFEGWLVANAHAIARFGGRGAGGLVTGVGNAALRMERELGQRVTSQWLGLVGGALPLCASPRQALDAGLVAAWRVGMAEARDAAIAKLSDVDEVTRRALVGTHAYDPSPARRFCTPGAEGPLGVPEVVGRAGRFVGFGGGFRRPPIVLAVQGRIVCTDSDASFELCADVFGARLVGAAWANEPGATASSEAGHGDAEFDPATGLVRFGDAQSTIPELAGATSWAVAGGVLAATLDHTHAVVVVGRREARA
jgi:hypothetical protein